MSAGASGPLALVIGTRPEVVQTWPLADAAAAAGIDLRILTVTQHTDPLMSTHVLPTSVTAAWRIEPVEVAPFSLGGALEAVRRHLEALRPSAVLVIGDTDSSMAGALAASELRLPVVHIEAGLRSGDWAMKEERNRVLIDHLATACCPPVARAADTLRAERVHGRIELTGDVHVDAIRLLHRDGLLQGADATRRPDAPLLCTVHRRENILGAAELARLVDLLVGLERPVHVALHPHTRLRLHEHGLMERLTASAHVELGEPLPFLDFIRALNMSPGVITDSGGVQKQAYLLGVPCLTLRSTTEWDETLTGGWNTLLDPATVSRLPVPTAPATARPEVFGDGHAAERILAVAAAPA